MAFFQCNFYSQSLCVNTNIGLIIPTPNSDEVLNKKSSDYFKPGISYQTLYLFHGAYGDYSDWMRLTGIERYAQERKVAVVMPSVANSFYQDMYRGERYLTYVAEELPRFVRTIFPLSSARDDNFTAGLSMGGYGALKVALTKPGNYACAASLSGAVDIAGLFKDKLLDDEARPFRLADIFRDPANIANTDADLFYLIKKSLKAGKAVPKLFLSCGTEDFLFETHVRGKKRLTELGVDAHFEEHPGIHDWDYWDTHIQKVLDWLPLRHSVID
jgi:S-formylglutathione hydrolase FrmB